MAVAKKVLHSEETDQIIEENFDWQYPGIKYGRPAKSNRTHKAVSGVCQPAYTGQSYFEYSEQNVNKWMREISDLDLQLEKFKNGNPGKISTALPPYYSPQKK